MNIRFDVFGDAVGDEATVIQVVKAVYIVLNVAVIVLHDEDGFALFANEHFCNGDNFPGAVRIQIGRGLV